MPQINEHQDANGVWTPPEDVPCTCVKCYTDCFITLTGCECPRCGAVYDLRGKYQDFATLDTE